MMINQNEKALRFRALHERPGVFVIPNPWDVGSSRMLAGLGFEALATSSAAAAIAIGRRDGGLTRDQALEQARIIVEATDLPVSADLESGFGDAPEIVAETVRRAAAVGLAGCTIEDTTRDRDRPLYGEALAIERIASAAEVVRGLPFSFQLTSRGPRGAPAPCRFRFNSPRAHTTCSSRARASTIRSGGSRHSNAPAPMCCSRRDCPTLARCAPSAPPSRSRSTSWSASRASRFLSPNSPRPA